MKKILLSLAAVALTASLPAQEKVVTETTVSATDLTTTVTHNVYNGNGDIILSITEGVSQTVFRYNELGQNSSSVFTDFVYPNQSRNYNYTYNEQGLVETVQELAGERLINTTTNSYDNHGNITGAIIASSMFSTATTYINTYDDGGHLIKVVMPHPMNPSIEFRTTLYTYEGDLLTKEEILAQGVASGYITYTYDANGNCTQSTSFDTEDNPISVTTYTYADIDASFAPYNVSAVANDGNTVTLTWEGTAGVVVFNGQWVEVSGNSYTTPVLLDGAYSFIVANNGNGVATEDIDVIDNTKVGVRGVQLTGDVTYSFETEKNASDEDVSVTYYNFPISWTLPEGSHPQGYKIYYNSNYFVTLEDGTARSFLVPARNTTLWSMAQGEYRLPFEIRVVAVYATGEAEPENLITYTLEQTEEIIAKGVATGVKVLPADAAATEVFTLGGTRADGQLRKGAYIVRQGNAVRKVLVK